MIWYSTGSVLATGAWKLGPECLVPKEIWKIILKYKYWNKKFQLREPSHFISRLKFLWDST